jgi:molybdopterin molybdotransferase
MACFDQALELVLSAVHPTETEMVDTLESVDRIAARAVIAPYGLPVFDNSAMDGYAVRAQDCRQGTSLDVIGFVPAGAATWPTLEAGTAIRVMTGARVPPSADTIVPLEDTEQDLNGKIRIPGEVRQGQYIRHSGEDVERGSEVIRPGRLLGVADVNLLAGLGITSVCVHRKPVVAILATGDELVPLGSKLSSGKIYDSNSLALAAAVKKAGATPLMLGIGQDNLESLQQKIAEGLEADALITAAGVSVGDRDLARDALAGLGAKEIFWGVKMKPGKATAFSVLSGKPVFSVPGNPVSAMITFEELVRPALLKMSGRHAVARPLVTAVLQDSLSKKPGRIFFARVELKIVDGRLLAWSAGRQDTGFQRTMLRADGIAVLPSEGAGYRAGDEIKVQILSSEFNLLEAEESLRAIRLACGCGKQPELVGGH